MATRYVSPYIQYFDATGLPLAGASLHFYFSGSSLTPQVTYNNQGLSVTNPNPIILDSAGSPGNVFLIDNSEYRVILKDVNGVTIFDMDPVNSFTVS